MSARHPAAGDNTPPENEFNASFRWDLDDSHSDDLLRLSRLLQHSRGFALLFCQFNDVPYRDRVIARVNEQIAHPGVWDLPNKVDVALLENQLPHRIKGRDCLHLRGLERWIAMEPDPVLRWLNYRRELIAKLAPLPLVFWLPPGQVGALAKSAPDLWAWRSALLDFSNAFRTLMDPRYGLPLFLGATDEGKVLRRLKEIRDYLATAEDTGSPQAYLMLEASFSLWRLNELAEALAMAEHSLKVYRSLDNRRGAATAWGQIANIMAARGDWSEALRIRREEELPVYERLGDIRKIAATQMHIADLLAAQGKLDDALPIYEPEVLKRYQDLQRLSPLGTKKRSSPEPSRPLSPSRAKVPGFARKLEESIEDFKESTEDLLDSIEVAGIGREAAITKAKIADILKMRGDHDEALRVYRNEVLPVLEAFGDTREAALVWGRIADVLQSRGEIDEALAIRRDEELPVYERLGATREASITRGKIASLLSTRGELDEALHIYMDDVLPVHQRSGEVRETAATQAQIADLLTQLGKYRDAENIYREKALPVFERLCSQLDLAICRVNLAKNLLKNPASTEQEHFEAKTLLCQSLADARRLRIPVLGSIESILAQHDLRCNKDPNRQAEIRASK